jgi:hypothetical protein
MSDQAHRVLVATVPRRVLGGRTISLLATSIDARIFAIAGAKPARVARGQLLAAGIAASAIDWRLQTGRLVRVHPGVYAVAPVIDGPARRRDRSDQLDGVRIHRSRLLTKADATIHKGLPITTPERTALDVAATLPDGDVELIVAEGYARNLFTERSLGAAIERIPNHAGAPTLKRAVNNPRRTEIGHEKELLRMIRAARLPDRKLHVIATITRAAG